MKRIITIQHTQSLQHTNGRIGSWTDWDLTALGVAQANRIGERLARELQFERCVLYSSDLVRARHTAEIIAGYLGVQPVFTSALREFDLGEAVGKTKDWARGHVRCPVLPGTLDWPEDAQDAPFLGAESKQDVWRRLWDFYQQMMADGKEKILLVSHDGALSLFFALWLGLEPEMLRYGKLSGYPGGVSFLREDEKGHRIIDRLNDTSYVKAATR